ncbi:WD repeat domain phosphoinositide-interacting protein 3 [Hypsizygus marmoreus]|uniref:WD repeat domain phosphoinositide-interacting protein 3 n=1 Tax=Hypsizygus marmoreus TaxID=39966 RepID=A0A369JN66_HYPMA|nr:WD repeat domain phosphoinositide-interacting protein 3 [Hypsizygus marmoreus]
MNLGRHTISATSPVHILDARFDPDCQIFTTSTPAGFAVYRTYPLELIRKRELSGGTLAAIVPLHTSNLLFLLGGGRSPIYPPNKVIFWDDDLGSEVAELEFRERVRGLACRRGWLAVALRRRVVVFQIAEQVTRYGEWDTCDNPKGLLAMATGASATLLAIAGRQLGHVQLVHLPPCAPPPPKGPPPSSTPRKPPPPPTKHPVSIIAAHTTALTTLSLPPSGRLLATTSSRGTLVRVWDALTGKLMREFRRGTDKAEIYGVAFRPDERELCVWSDKGTVHVFTLVTSGASNRQSTFSPLTPFLPLPKYFESEWSYAQYRIPTQSAHISISASSRRPAADVPDEERCVVGWIAATPENASDRETEKEYQLVALTYTGGWYRLSLPSHSNASISTSASSGATPLPLSSSPPRPASMARPRTSSASSVVGRDKGKEREREKEGKESRDCVLQEFRRFGRWDGWG